MSPSFEPPLASAGLVSAVPLPHHSRRAVSSRVSLHWGVLLRMRSKRMRLTQSSLFGLSYCKGDGREQFDYDLYDDPFHRRGGWDLCIYVEAPKERFERLE